MILQSDLHWKTHLTSLEKKLSRSIGLLSKIRNCVPKFLLKTIYYSIVNSHLIYGCEVWGLNQNNVLVKRLQKHQEKAVRLINFETNPNVVGQWKKSALILEKKALISSNLMLNLLFKMSSREYLREKTAKLFLEGAFFSGIFDKMFIGVR